MPALSIVNAWRDQPARTMALMGLVSGILSATIGFDHEWGALSPVASLVFLDAGPLPAGLFFASVIALGMLAWVRPPWAALVGFVVTMYAWSGAIHSAIRLQRNRDDDPHLIAASLCAGAVGAGLTHLGCALFVRELRRPWRIGLTCVVGAILGMLFYLGQRKYIDERLLFVIWQPAVAFCIGLGLEGRRT